MLELELIFRKVDVSGVVTPKDAFKATCKTLKIYTHLPELYYLIVGITLMIFSAQIFVVPGVDYGQSRPLVFAISSVVGVLVPMVLAFVTLPPHLLFKANIWALTFLNVTLSALLFSWLQPFIASAFFSEGVADFIWLLWPVFVFYFFAEFYMLMRINATINFSKYLERHASCGIEMFIPADKLGPLMALSAQDHYVEIITQMGSHLERMTIKKAIGLVPECAGLQIHRSHWVAYSAILDLEKTGERYAVLLRNGAKLPVGKSKVQELQSYLENR